MKSSKYENSRVATTPQTAVLLCFLLEKKIHKANCAHQIRVVGSMLDA